VYLLDTNLISEATRRRANEGVKRWLEVTERKLCFVSVVTIAEIRYGIERLKARSDPTASRTEAWLGDVYRQFRDRILPVSSSVAERWGKLRQSLGHGGEDVVIGATALEHDLIVVTRNARDFAQMGVRIEDPYS
jgi:predicted nucleic acid-binding protein